MASLRGLLEGGAAASASPPRHLQAPLSFRTCGGVLGACGDALQYCETMIGIELNAHQQNPLCIEDEDRVQSCGNFEMQALATTLDLARIALAPCLTSQVERSVKMLQASQTGLTDGLQPHGEDVATRHGLSEYTWVLQAMASEARLLVQPVSCEIGASQAEGIEDRMTLAGLAARRLQEMVSIMRRCCAVSAIIACQAIDLRYQYPMGRTEHSERLRGATLVLGPRLRPAYEAVRRVVPAMRRDEDSAPQTRVMHALVDALCAGALGEEVAGAATAAAAGAAAGVSRL